MRRRRTTKVALAALAASSGVVMLAAPALAWRSPINAPEGPYAPPGPPGSNPVGTACRVDTMNGEYAGTAFAKLRLDYGPNNQSHCIDATVQVVYQQGSGVAGGSGASGICCGSWIQDIAPGRNIVGANFAVEVNDYNRVIYWSTGVFG